MMAGPPGLNDCEEEFHRLVGEVVELLPAGVPERPRPAWDEAAILCARTLGRWGGNLGRAALLAQIRSELEAPDGRGARPGDAKALAGRAWVDVRLETIDSIPGAEVPLLLACAHPVDDAGGRAGPSLEIALPERLCRLAGVAGLSALIEPGRVLRVSQPRAPLDAALLAPLGAPQPPQLLPSELSVPILDGRSEEDDLLAMCAVSHGLAEVDAAAFARGARFTLLCRVGAVELSPALAALASELQPGGAPAWAVGARAPPEVAASEVHWARLGLAEGAGAPSGHVELLLLGAHARLALCAGAGRLLLLHEPYVQSGAAHSTERAVLRYGAATVVALVAEVAPSNAAGANGAGGLGTREGARRADAGANAVLLGGCLAPAALSGRAEPSGRAEASAGGRVRATLLLAAAAPPRAVRVCAPARACAQLELPPRLPLRAEQGGPAAAAAGSARSWCALASVVDAGAGEAPEFAGLPWAARACACAECDAEAGATGCGAEACDRQPCVCAAELFVFSLAGTHA